ncbi:MULTISPECIES: ABC transporter substrate-binding protein [Paenibacillus]|uniref:ABC transporter substrate-binding protein n=1 Tax=Paenibacillus albilobatus TaxID=2716884 RepID=A0A920C8A0_9BACL|nr:MULTISPECIES: ABC transporter substrate-binding protein [Paenibacillus]GIO29725.1 ABC transporter substrate-binding protein [Paenibacillus albilobatus]
MLKKKWLPVVMSVILGAALAGCGSSDGKKTEAGGSETQTDKKTYKIAISQIMEHPSLDATREGFLAALKDAGISEGDNLKVDYKNAQGDAATNLSIAQTIASNKEDLVFTIATGSTQAVVKQVKDKPIVFASVTDPVDAKIVSNLEKPGGNVTGVSDTNPAAVQRLTDFIAKYFPNIKTVGLVINEGEPNAEVMAKNAEEMFGKHNIKLVRAAVTNTSEVKQAAQSLVGRSDAFFTTLDNTVVSGVDSIIQVANENHIPFFSSDYDTVEKGAFATVGFKYFDHGYEAGKIAVDILKNGKNPGDIPVSMQEKLDVVLNLKAAEAQGVTVTDEMKNEVQDKDNYILNK